MSAKRIFISFAIEDERYRDLLKGQASNKNSPFTFTDMSVKEPWSSQWKTNCRTRIKGCDGVIALLSKHTQNADGAKWEMQCTIEENIPIMGMYIHNEEGCQIPSQLQGKRIYNWSWDTLENFINRL